MNPLSIIGGLAKSDALSSIAEALSGNAAGAAPVAGTSFVDALGDVAGKVVDTLKRSESLSIQALGGADVVMSAEQSLQAAIAIRDKIVSAYLEVSRMAI